MTQPFAIRLRVSGLPTAQQVLKQFLCALQERVAVEGKKRKELQTTTYTWRYEEPKYVKYDLKF